MTGPQTVHKFPLQHSNQSQLQPIGVQNHASCCPFIPVTNSYYNWDLCTSSCLSPIPPTPTPLLDLLGIASAPFRSQQEPGYASLAFPSCSWQTQGPALECAVSAASQPAPVPPCALDRNWPGTQWEEIPVATLAGQYPKAVATHRISRSCLHVVTCGNCSFPRTAWDTQRADGPAGWRFTTPTIT